MKQIGMDILSILKENLFFSKVSQNWFIVLNNSLNTCLLVCFMCPIDTVPFHLIQKFIYIFVGNCETEIQVKLCTWDHIWKGTPNLQILSPALRQSGCHKLWFFDSVNDRNTGYCGPAMNLDPGFVAEALQYMMNPVKNCASWNASKNITLKKEAFNKSQWLLKKCSL